MVEIYKVIAYIPSINQIFDNKNKNGSVKGANNYQEHIMRGNFYADRWKSMKFSR